MNKMQVRSAQVTLEEIKEELIEKKKKTAEYLACIEAQIEAVMTLMPVLVLKEDMVIVKNEPPAVEAAVPPP